MSGAWYINDKNRRIPVSASLIGVPQHDSAIYRTPDAHDSAGRQYVWKSADGSVTAAVRIPRSIRASERARGVTGPDSLSWPLPEERVSLTFEYTGTTSTLVVARVYGVRTATALIEFTAPPPPGDLDREKARVFNPVGRPRAGRRN